MSDDERFLTKCPECDVQFGFSPNCGGPFHHYDPEEETENLRREIAQLRARLKWFEEREKRIERNHDWSAAGRALYEKHNPKPEPGAST